MSKSVMPAQGKDVSERLMSATAAPAKLILRRDFGEDLLLMPDEALGAELAGKAAALDFNKAHEDIYELEAAEQELARRYDASRAQNAYLEQEKDAIPQKILSFRRAHPKDAEDDENELHESIPFKLWSFRDRLYFLMSLAFAAILLIVTMVSVVVGLQSSGQQVFINEPWMCWLLAMMAPAASVGLKFVGHCFDSYRAKRLYSRLIFLLMVLLLLLWALLYAINFPGVSAQFDWSSFGQAEGNAKSSMLVFVQLFAEIITGTALFLVATDISLKYEPDHKVDNPAYLQAVKAYEEHHASHEKLEAQFKWDTRKLASLRDEREAWRLKAIVAYKAARARRQQASQY